MPMGPLFPNSCDCSVHVARLIAPLPCNIDPGYLSQVLNCYSTGRRLIWISVMQHIVDDLLFA